MEFQPMSPEEIERTMQFLLHQQAQFAADFERLSAKTDQIADGLAGLTGIVGHVTEHLGNVTHHLGHVTERVGQVTDGLAQLTDRVGQLATVQERTDHQMKDLERLLTESDHRLSAHITTVESHLNAVVDLFERHLREDHGPPN